MGGRNRQLDLRLRDARQTAWGQSGLLTSGDLWVHGLANRAAYSRLVSRGLLVPVYQGLWRLPDACVNEHLRLAAACLWAGRGVLCGRTAWRLHGLDSFGTASSDPPVPADDSLEPIHVAIHHARSHPPEGVCVHRVKLRRRGAVVKVDGLSVTSVGRTLVDLAAEFEEGLLQEAVEAAWFKRKLNPAALLRALKSVELRGRDGVAVLRRLLSEALGRRRPLESVLEVRAWRAMRRAGLPPPEVQVDLRDPAGAQFRVDFFFRGERLIVEALGFRAHGTRERFEKDAARSAQLTAMGFAVLPVTWRMIVEQEADTLRWIAEALRARRTPAALRAA